MALLGRRGCHLERDESSIGRVGVLIVGTRGADGPGEVLIKIRGGSEAFLAWSEKPLPRGATVLVIESRGARAVDVIEWEDVLGDTPRIPGLLLLRRMNEDVRLPCSSPRRGHADFRTSAQPGRRAVQGGDRPRHLRHARVPQGPLPYPGPAGSRGR